MTTIVSTFCAIPMSRPLADRVAASAPLNPFLTPAYGAAQESLGGTAWAFWIDTTGPGRAHGDDGPLHGATVGMLRSGRLTRSLTILSTPSLPPDSPFWEGLLAFLARERITELELSSFGALDAHPPTLPGETERIAREEFPLDLNHDDLLGRMSSTHRRWIRRAAREGVAVHQTDDLAALTRHSALYDDAMERRSQRGEAVGTSATQEEGYAALLRSGAATLFQATREGAVLSSLVIVHAHRGAYLASAGTSEAGRAIGASHFLVSETAQWLRDEGRTTFNLGGVRADESGLRAYKAAFGAPGISMESVWVARSAGWRSVAAKVLQRLR